jgi:hypothetical protein
MIHISYSRLTDFVFSKVYNAYCGSIIDLVGSAIVRTLIDRIRSCAGIAIS